MIGLWLSQKMPCTGLGTIRLKNTVGKKTCLLGLQFNVIQTRKKISPKDYVLTRTKKMENLNLKKIIISFDHYNSFMRRVLSICLTDENTVYITRVCQRQGLNPDLPA